MLATLLQILIPTLGKIAGGVLKTETEYKVLGNLVGELSTRVPGIIMKHGTDVRFQDIDFDALEGEGWGADPPPPETEPEKG